MVYLLWPFESFPCNNFIANSTYRTWTCFDLFCLELPHVSQRRTARWLPLRRCRRLWVAGDIICWWRKSIYRQWGIWGCTGRNRWQIWRLGCPCNWGNNRGHPFWAFLLKGFPGSALLLFRKFFIFQILQQRLMFMVPQNPPSQHQNSGQRNFQFARILSIS